MSDQINEQELVQFIADRSKSSLDSIRLVLKHEADFINQAQQNADGEVEIDGDELVDYVLSRSDVKLDELTVETILDLEMDYLTEHGLAGYID
ncbi:hypothetical protein D3C76_86810 [compost metagenome]|uniref:Uncharacterized protein n=1 Tax=Paenibacillus rhizolycopersici TaxID=2780073 RepID=A0ABS2H870_9BACL|nr:hypothetical protein [Paenibacillus sp. J53TS2]MBM6996194.1 hypothetical protein [Paenibacillus rhizolycopersici]MUG85051.1 hypothetical protein [Paenibacillus timonensis]GIP47675.1 hypothetical protein J53TS2_12660 [Paenibacillus sp. J53TS2]